MTTSRQSNIELLRILSMAAVIMVHLDGASIGLPTPESLSAATAADWWRIIVESITIIGVNCFTLISGYFGIRAKFSKLLQFTLMCMFYAVGIYTVCAFFKPQIWSWTEWIESWMVFTHTDLWYVPAYLILFLLSPMLNAVTDTLPFRKFGFWLLLFVVANIWCGWLWGASFNANGYTPVQLIMMYLIGRFISRWIKECMPLRKRLQIIAGFTYIAMVAVTALLAIWMKPLAVYAYNSPWVIVSSIAAFLFFTTVRLQSKTINAFAKGAFAAYLIHKNPLVWGNIIRPTALHFWDMNSLWIYTIFTLLFTTAVYAASATVDSIRAILFRKVESLIDNKVKVQT